MGLIKCPDCGKEISDSAPTCPNCGRPMKVEESSEAPKPQQVKKREITDVPEGYKKASDPSQGVGLIVLGSLGSFAALIWAFIAGLNVASYTNKNPNYVIPLILFVVSLVVLLVGYSRQQEITYFECPNCGYLGKKTKRVIKGSGCLEIFLWLFFIIPGILYTIYRSTTEQAKVCPNCEYPHLKKWKLEKLPKKRKET